MSHLETLIAEYLEWQGYLIRRNMKVGRRSKGGWEMELDVVGYHPQVNKIIHYEPSIDALGWTEREALDLAGVGKTRELASHNQALTFESRVLSDFTGRQEQNRRDIQLPGRVTFFYTSVQYDIQTKTGAQSSTITNVTKKERPTPRAP